MLNKQYFREKIPGTYNLIKIKSQHFLPIFYRLFTSHRMEDLKTLF
jgi:hypothetical protein